MNIVWSTKLNNSKSKVSLVKKDFDVKSLNKIEL